MKNEAKSEVGRYISVYSTSPNPGDKKSPTPFSYRIIRTNMNPWIEYSYYGYTGEYLRYASLPGLGLAGLNTKFRIGRTPDPVLTAPDWGDLQDRAMGRMYDQLRGQSEVLVDLAEGGQTLRMLKNAVSLRRLATEFTNKFVRGGRRHRADYLSGKWMEYRYGWGPLVHSIYDAADNLSRRVHEDVWTVSGRSSWRDTRYNRDSDRATGMQFVENETVDCRCLVQGRFQPPNRTLQAVANWTSLNPATIAWELLPYSFVADWFFNIGDQLRALENHVLYQDSFAGGFITRTMRVNQTGSYRFSTRVGPFYDASGEIVRTYYGAEGAQSVTSESKHLSRELLYLLPPPNGVRFKVELNAKRLLDSAILLRNAFKR